MGSMATVLAAAIIERFGRRHWDEYLALLDGFWKTVRAELDDLALDYEQVDLYQDGLPVCGKELEIVGKAAAAGSENHQLLVLLAGRGATLMGTEDPRLLLEEYRDVEMALKDGRGPDGVPKRKTSHLGSPDRSPVGRQMPPARPAQRLSRRDAWIGRRIDVSLRPGRTGILFLGMMHHVEEYLPADIVVTRLRVIGDPAMARNGKAAT